MLRHADASQPAALLLCGDATVPCGVLERTVLDAGFAIVSDVHHWAEAVERVADLEIDVAVVDLALAGTVGVRVVPVLRSASPTCEVIVISPLRDFDLSLLEAGAAAIVDPTDLRPLIEALGAIAQARAHA